MIIKKCSHVNLLFWSRFYVYKTTAPGPLLCELIPSTSRIFVGFLITTDGDQGPWVKVLPQKIRKLKRAIVNVLRIKTVTARQLARVTGQCVSMIKAIVPGKLLLRNVYRCLSMRNSWDSYITITEPAAADLRWWLSATNGWNGAPLTNQKTVDCQLMTDASSYRWGGTVFNQNASGLWPVDVQQQHSNFKELLAVYLCVKLFVHLLFGKSVQVLSDNVTTVAYLNHLGGPILLMSELMKTIWSFAHAQDITLTGKHLV